MTTPELHDHEPPAGRSTSAGAAMIWGVLGLCVVAPGALTIASIARGAARVGLGDGALSRGHLGLLAMSIACAASIALIATVLAWPVAGVIARARPGASLLAAAPMLLPTYLAYAGWSILRAPTTPLGKWIGAAPEHGMPMLPILVGRGLALWGLALWAWPLAALTMAAGQRALGAEVLESLRLDAKSAPRRVLALACALRHSIGAAWLLVFLLMLGSAIPLHVAQVPTYAIHAWQVLDQHPAEPWRAWVSAWPLVVAAAAAGWALASPLSNAGRALAALGTEDSRAPRPSRLNLALACLPWVLAILAPFGLFSWSMGSTGALGRFLRDAHRAIVSSGLIAIVVGLLGAVLCLAAAHASSTAAGARRSRTWLGLALVWALIPGALVGSSIAQFMRIPAFPRVLADSPFPVVVAHLSRFAFLPLLVGTWLSATESGAVGDQRRLDGAVSVAGWARTALAGHAGPALAVAMAVGCLSLHEIESSIQVQPPGLDHLAQRLLQWLHYERMTELSAASVLLLGIGIVASAAGMVAARAGRVRTGRGYHR